MTRSHDRGARSSNYDHEFAVRCPRCDRRAHVTVDRQAWRARGARVICAGCGYAAAWTPGERRGKQVGLVRRRCRNCGRELELRFSGAPHRHAALLRCPGCGAGMLETIHWQRVSPSVPSEPYFGLPLWFVGRVKGDVFWAYNTRHLEFLRRYLDADLRFRTPNVNSSIASRLPRFLLDRKNRRAVVKELATMARG
jgi:hypothetical protein